MDEKTGGNGRPAKTDLRTIKTEADRRRQFAEGIARAEFGRFYWKPERPKPGGADKRRPNPSPPRGGMD